MRVGVAKEIKPQEYRVALTPAGARELVQRGRRQPGQLRSIRLDRLKPMPRRQLDGRDLIDGNADAPRRQAEPCSGEAYLGFSPSEPPPERVTLGENSFSKESGHDAGAGNIFSYVGYSTAKDDICLSLIFVLHSTNPANYDNSPPEYNWEEETAIFEEIVSTLRWR